MSTKRWYIKPQDGERLATLDTILSRKDAEDFARLTLSEIATRAPSKHQKAPFVSLHRSRQTDPKYLRGSDLSLRLHVSVGALMLAGYTQHEALVRATELGKKFLGRTRRGRPRLGTAKADFLDAVASVRSMVNAFAKRTQNPEQVVHSWVGQFLWERAIGATRGSEYDPHFGRMMHEAGVETMRVLRRRYGLR